jgi:hypothetical protein
LDTGTPVLTTALEFGRMRRILLLAESLVVLRVWRLLRSQDREAARTQGDESDLVLAKVAVEHAAAQLDAQMGDSDTLDLKALGLLTVDVAAITILVATHESLNRFWWIAAALLGVGAFFFLAAQRLTEFDRGPDILEFRSENTGASPVRITETMLSDLLLACDRNEPVLRQKIRNVEWGSRFLVVGVILGLVLALVG